MANQKLRDEVETLKRLLAAERNARVDAEVKAASAEAKAINAVAAATRASAEAARAFADVSSAEALIAHLKLAIEKLRRELYGSSSERGRKLAGSQMLDQMELTLEELEATAAEDEIAAEMAAAKTDSEAAASRIRRKPVRKPFPAHLPRERVIVPGPSACACCCGRNLPAGPARKSVRRLRLSMFCRAVSPGQVCLP